MILLHSNAPEKVVSSIIKHMMLELKFREGGHGEASDYPHGTEEG